MTLWTFADAHPWPFTVLACVVVFCAFTLAHVLLSALLAPKPPRGAP